MSDTIESLLAEGRTFPPPEDFKKSARVTGTDVYDEAERRLRGLLGPPGRRAPRLVEGLGHDPRVGPAVREVVRRRQAQRRRTTASTATSPPATATRSRTTGRASRATPGRSPTPSCSTTSAVSRTRSRSSASARATASTIYLGMVPELPMALLACARIGARTRSCSAASRPTRCATASTTPRPRCSITGDGAWRRGNVCPAEGDRRRRGRRVPVDREGARAAAHRERRRRWTDGRDVWWHDLVPAQSTDCPPEPMDAEDLLYLLYTSGTTGEAQGHHAHDRRLPHPGRVHAPHVFDLHPDDDVYWCAADFGWVTGHSYIVYGPLANRHDERDVRGHARPSRTRTGSGRSSRSTASRSSTPRPRRSGPS